MNGNIFLRVLRVLCGISFSGHTHKTGSVIRISAAFVLRGLRIRAQRPRHLGVCAVLPFELRRDDRSRRRAFLHPLLQRGVHAVLWVIELQITNSSERVRPGTAAAVLHAWRHVKAHKRIHILLPHLLDHARRSN